MSPNEDYTSPLKIPGSAHTQVSLHSESPLGYSRGSKREPLHLSSMRCRGDPGRNRAPTLVCPEREMGLRRRSQQGRMSTPRL